MTLPQVGRLDLPVDAGRDHVLGDDTAEITLVEYGSYACPHCHAAHQVVSHLRERFGDRLRYVYRHLPLTDRTLATHAAELAECAAETGRFWEFHDLLMSRSYEFTDADLEQVAAEFGLPSRDERIPEVASHVKTHVRDDAQSGLRSGARGTPTFFINGRRYDGAWDESALAEALLGSVGYRLRTATLDFASWAPSTGLLLLVMSVLAVAISNTALGPAFEAWWETPFGFRVGEAEHFVLPLVDWVNHGLLTIFFLVVGLEIKRELTVGRLATPRAAALPIVGALGGMTLPALIYLLVIAPASLAHGWGLTIATDTAFAVALIVLLGARVPVDLRIFLTAAVIVDDLVAIAVVAVFYSDAIVLEYLVAAAAITVLLAGLNRWGVYRALPYAVLGVVLWACLHEGGLHATLAGVVLAVVTPTRPPANLSALMAQAQSVIQAERARDSHGMGKPEDESAGGLSRPALEALDVIHDRIESPASKLLRGMEPWSSYVVLPIFALANAGVAWSSDVLDGRGALVLAIVLGLVVGKPAGILAGARLAVGLGIAQKPPTYSWRQLLGAAALGGIGFTMSLFIARQAFPGPGDFLAAKVAIFLASLIAGVLGVAILWPAGRGPSRSGEMQAIS